MELELSAHAHPPTARWGRRIRVEELLDRNAAALGDQGDVQGPTESEAFAGESIHR
ncbi:MAG: hypothetical protein JWQ95_7000 [Sphaerisporangium sp.]|nr:hypothetical protein [Sphaerisporangium sp.]